MFGFSDGEFRQLDDSTDVSQSLMGHIVNQTIYSSTLKEGDVITPSDGNFSLHVTTVGHS